MSRIIFNSQKEWVDAMKKCATYRTAYRNQYPWNLLYWDGSILWADCSNFQKALFNGRNVYNMVAGTYQSDLSNTGDCTELGLILQCSDISFNFGKLKYGEPRLLQMDGHIGAYIGEEIKIGNYVYNVIEWTAWDGDFGAGCIYSYVDKYGIRYNHKGGYQCLQWERNGKPEKWVKYVPVYDQLDVDGEWGYKTTLFLQRYLGTEQDGEVSNQESALKKFCLNCVPINEYAGSWEWADGGGYSPMIKALQKWLGMPDYDQDGQFGSNTIRALQKKLGVEIDGYCGVETVSALQRFLNNNVK